MKLIYGYHIVSSFVYGLFNNVVGSSSYLALKSRMIGEKLIGNAVEGRCCDAVSSIF
jgi:hypothetical protein